MSPVSTGNLAEALPIWLTLPLSALIWAAYLLVITAPARRARRRDRYPRP